MKKLRAGCVPTGQSNVEFFGESMVSLAESHSSERELRVLSACYMYPQLPTKNRSFYVNPLILWAALGRYFSD